MKRFILISTFVLLASAASHAGNGSRASSITPDETFLFAKRDTCDLFLDIYEPASGTDTLADGRMKPTVIFAFGGSFMTGSRDAENYREWFRAMADNGYRIVSIDYRARNERIRQDRRIPGQCT